MICHTRSIGTSWSSGLSGQDHYNDQLSWRQVSNADGTASFTQTALNQVWGSATTTWASQGWGSLSGAGSGNVWNLGGSSSSVYGLAVSWVGFSGSAAFLLGPGGSGPSAFGIKIGLPTGGGGPLQYLQYAAMGWWEANSFGTFSAGTPPSQWARGGLIAGHEVALSQGVGEVLFGAGAIGGGGLISLTGIGAFIGVPAGVVGAVVVLHGGAVTVSAAGLLGRDFSVAMSSVTPGAPGGAVPGRGLDDILKDNDLFNRWLNRPHPNNQPLSPADATKVWDKLKSLGKAPRLDAGHPGTQWTMPHINVDGVHIPVDPGFVPPPP